MYDTNLLSASSLIGNSVRNTAGQDLGTVKEFMIDTRTGNITYAVLSFGGFMGLGNKLFAIPYPLLRVDTTNECYVLNIEKEVLKDAPGFDSNNWPDAANYDFVNQVYSYYGYDPFYDEAYEVSLRKPTTKYEPAA